MASSSPQDARHRMYVSLSDLTRQIRPVFALDQMGDPVNSDYEVRGNPLVQKWFKGLADLFKSGSAETPEEKRIVTAIVEILTQLIDKEDAIVWLLEQNMPTALAFLQFVVDYDIVNMKIHDPVFRCVTEVIENHFQNFEEETNTLLMSQACVALYPKIVDLLRDPDNPYKANIGVYLFHSMAILDVSKDNLPDDFYKLVFNVLRNTDMRTVDRVLLYEALTMSGSHLLLDTSAAFSFIGHCLRTLGDKDIVTSEHETVVMFKLLEILCNSTEACENMLKRNLTNVVLYCLKHDSRVIQKAAQTFMIVFFGIYSKHIRDIDNIAGMTALLKYLKHTVIRFTEFQATYTGQRTSSEMAYRNHTVRRVCVSLGAMIQHASVAELLLEIPAGETEPPFLLSIEQRIRSERVNTNKIDNAGNDFFERIQYFAGYCYIFCVLAAKDMEMRRRFVANGVFDVVLKVVDGALLFPNRLEQDADLLDATRALAAASVLIDCDEGREYVDALLKDGRDALVMVCEFIKPHANWRFPMPIRGCLNLLANYLYGRLNEQEQRPRPKQHDLVTVRIQRILKCRLAHGIISVLNELVVPDIAKQALRVLFNISRRHAYPISRFLVFNGPEATLNNLTLNLNALFYRNTFRWSWTPHDKLDIIAEECVRLDFAVRRDRTESEIRRSHTNSSVYEVFSLFLHAGLLAARCPKLFASAKKPREDFWLLKVDRFTQLEIRGFLEYAMTNNWRGFRDAKTKETMIELAKIFGMDHFAVEDMMDSRDLIIAPEDHTLAVDGFNQKTLLRDGIPDTYKDALKLYSPNMTYELYPQRTISSWRKDMDTLITSNGAATHRSMDWLVVYPETKGLSSSHDKYIQDRIARWCIDVEMPIYTQKEQLQKKKKPQKEEEEEEKSQKKGKIQNNRYRAETPDTQKGIAVNKSILTARNEMFAQFLVTDPHRRTPFRPESHYAHLEMVCDLEVLVVLVQYLYCAVDSELTQVLLNNHNLCIRTQRAAEYYSMFDLQYLCEWLLVKRIGMERVRKLATKNKSLQQEHQRVINVIVSEASSTGEYHVMPFFEMIRDCITIT